MKRTNGYKICYRLYIKPKITKKDAKWFKHLKLKESTMMKTNPFQIGVNQSICIQIERRYEFQHKKGELAYTK